MGVNNFLPFCPTDTGTNLPTQGEYAVLPDRTTGNQPGVASSKLNNKALRQSAAMAASMGQYITNLIGSDVLDNGVTATLTALITSAMKPISPVVQRFLTGSGTFNKTYVFTITSGSATAGATYTNNAITFTVVSTIASQTTLLARGSAAPEFQGTLTKSGGTGDNSITFQAFRAPLYLEVELAGGGGGGGGAGDASNGGTGGTGGTTTFGADLSATGGTGGIGTTGATAGDGGTATVGSSAIALISLDGSVGNPGHETQGVLVGWLSNGGAGGATPFSGAGGGSNLASSGFDGISNTGSGGGGGGNLTGAAAGIAGGGGGSGAYIKAIIQNPAATYSYAIGASGTAGTAGAGGTTGGIGGSGVVIVTEHYQ